MMQPNDHIPSILFLGTQMTVGGAQRVLFDQASWFHKKGYRVTAAFIYDKDKLHAKWQKLYPFPIVDLRAHRFQRNIVKNLFLLIVGVSRILSLFRRNKFDIIETFTPHSNLFGIPLAFFARIPVRIATHHGDVFNKSTRWVGKLHGWMVNCGIASKLVVVSEDVRKNVETQDGVHPECISIILNGINLPKQNKPLAEIRACLQKELPVSKDAVIVLTVGRMSKQKGHTYLLDAIPLVLEKTPNVVFLFAGDGDLRISLQNQVDRLGIGHVVHFLGTRDDVPDLLAISDIFVLPSLWEGLPLALLEAMGAGKPVVATRVEGVETLVIDGENGFLIPPADVDSLAEALIRIIRDPAIQKQFGHRGELLVENEYTVERMCAQYESLFLSLYQQAKTI